jgi:hypothetical protein
MLDLTVACNLILSNSRLRSPAFHPNSKGKGVGREKAFPIGWAHLYQSANFYVFYVNRKRERARKRGRKGWWELILCLRIDTLRSMGKPMSEVTLTLNYS